MPDFLNTVYTLLLNESELKPAIGEIIGILDKNKITEVELLFAVAWGITYKNWTPYEVNIHSILTEIEKAEDIKAGKIGDDDLYISIPHLETEILICHERDIHLAYNQENQVVTDILLSWKSRNLVRFIRAGNAGNQC